ncbi:MAG: hypothetical protein ACKO8W_12330, partial [Dolichospermum sp.]
TQAILGDFESAMWAYRKALELNQNNPRTYELMAGMFKKKGQNSKATSALQKALSLYRLSNDLDSVNRVEGMLREM